MLELIKTKEATWVDLCNIHHVNVLVFHCWQERESAHNQARYRPCYAEKSIGADKGRATHDGPYCSQNEQTSQDLTMNVAEGLHQVSNIHSIIHA